MYQPSSDRASDAAAARALGWDFDGTSGPSQEIEVWPDTWPSVQVFDALGSQWIYAGMGGVPTGLRYSSIEPVLRRCKVPDDAWDDVFDDIRVMEAAALQEMHRQHKLQSK